jgi:hypothetical protein
MESRELHVATLGVRHALFPWGVRDITVEVNEHLRAASVSFHEAMEDGVWQGAASALAMVHFRFLGLVDVSEVAEELPRDTRDSDMVLLMPLLEEAADTVLAVAPLEVILCGPLLDHKG